MEPIPDTTKLEYRGLFLKPVEITAIRAGDKTPFTQITLGSGQIAKMNNGRDLPYILEQTPSVVVSSDAGNGFGYTGISIRGTDASRINMTLNGLPYNDAESQAIYFVDLPDFASSTSSVQIQRGVGTSSNGAGAFGASMNFSTNEFQPNRLRGIQQQFWFIQFLEKYPESGIGFNWWSFYRGYASVAYQQRRISLTGPPAI